GTVRAAIRHAGGIRIDHAMGLRRLWVVPHGAGATEGAYLRYPEADMFRLLCLESWRNRAVVVGEDLGTVPEGFRDVLDARAVMGMRVLWFERDGAGRFIPPDRWSSHAAAMTSTHDLPTVAGWWRGRDIDWTWSLGRMSRFAAEASEREERAAHRRQLWDACVDAGVAWGLEPAAEDTGPVVDAALSYVSRTPAPLAILPMEDLLGLEEQPNLPGTIDEHPNWRRRLPACSEALFKDPAVAARIGRLEKSRTT
ncbi:MAG: 4-alpha-glucanotransferase, partial [Alphaproteobacteria bacterium]|nr:4-alpha-glucanotransferase [Alphaproteobacteria bacterium]